MRSRRAWRIVGIAVALATTTLGACQSSSGPGATGADASAEASTITIGVSDSLTGGLSALGIGANQTLNVAAQQINQVGILGGRHVVFDVRDDTSDPGQSRLVVQSLLAEGVAGVLGPLSSGQVQNVQDLTYQAKVVEITSTATSILLTTDQPAGDRYLFRTAPPDNLQGHAIVEFVRDGIPAASSDGGDAGTLGGTCRTTFIVNGKDAYGSVLGDTVQNEFPQGDAGDAGASVLGRYEVPTTLQSDYSAAVGQVVAAHPDCLVLIAYSDVGSEFLRELAVGIAADTGDWSRFFVCGSDGEYDGNFIPDGQSDPADAQSPNSTAGCYGTAPDTAPATPEYAAFRGIWQQSYPGLEPPAYAANQYDAALLLALAIQKAGGSMDGPAIRDALRMVSTSTTTSTTFGPADFVDAVDALSKGIEIDYNGASGNCEFNPTGDVKTNYIVWQVQRQPGGSYAFARVGEIPSANL